MTIQNNPELQKLTLELTHEEAAIVADALKTAHKAANDAGKIVHPILAGIHRQFRRILKRFGILRSKKPRFE